MPGFGRGMGRGMGYGRGLGKGMGRRWDRVNEEFGSYYGTAGTPDNFDSTDYHSKTKYLEYLKGQARVLEEQLEQVLNKIKELEKETEGESYTGKNGKNEAVIASVDPAKCIACRICEKVCPEGAIKVINGVAVVEPDLCTGCGNCVYRCPRGAIALVPGNMNSEG